MTFAVRSSPAPDRSAARSLRSGRRPAERGGRGGARCGPARPASSRPPTRRTAPRCTSWVRRRRAGRRRAVDLEPSGRSGRPSPARGRSQRSGWNRSGSAHHRGSRCSKAGLTRHIVPTGTVRPPSTTGSRTRRLNIQEGGHSRNVSARTAVVRGSGSASSPAGSASGLASHSASRSARTAGAWSIAARAQVRAMAVVSCPASSNVITSSRTCPSVSSG